MHKNSDSARMYLVKTSPENKKRKNTYNKAFAQRTKIIRTAAGLEADEVAKALRVKKDTYYRYESKIAMPHYLLGQFLKMTNGDAIYLMGWSNPQRKPKLLSVD